MGHVARFGVYVETIGTFGVFIALAIFGFHHGLGFIFSSQDVEFAADNPLGLNFGGDWWTGAALVAVLANVYIFYGFESAGDISEETLDAQRQVPARCVMRCSTAGSRPSSWCSGCCSRRPHRVSAASLPAVSTPFSAELPGWLQDFFLLMVIVAFFSCGTAVQGAGARVAFALARDGALPLSDKIRAVSPRHHTPANAILVGTIVPFLFLLLVLVNPSKPVHVLGSTIPRTSTRCTRSCHSRRPESTSRSFSPSSERCRARAGWRPSGAFTLGWWGLPITIGGALYLALCFSTSSGRARSRADARYLQLRMGDASSDGDHHHCRHGV